MLLQIMSVKKSLHASMIMFTITVKNVSLFILMIFICSCCTHSSGLGVLVWNVIYTRYMYIAKGKCIWEGYTIPGRFLQLLPLKISVWSMSYKTCQNEKNKGKLKKKNKTYTLDKDFLNNSDQSTWTWKFYPVKHFNILLNISRASVFSFQSV